METSLLSRFVEISAYPNRIDGASAVVPVVGLVAVGVALGVTFLRRWICDSIEVMRSVAVLVGRTIDRCDVAGVP